MIRLILLGPPGAGKGTQAERVSKELAVPHISTGVILRQAVTDQTELGRQAQDVMEKGGLVSDDIMLGIIRERLASSDCAQGFILDGYPRTIPQAEALEELLAERESPPVILVNLDLDEEELERRIEGRRGEGRRDDDPEAMRERFRVYQKETRPLLEHYRSRVRHLDGKGTPDDVFERLTGLLRVAASEERGS